MPETETNMTPGEHAQRIATMLRQAQQECRADIERIDDPRALALFETIAEAVGGLMTALEHYQAGNERAWQPSTGRHEAGKGSVVERTPEGQRVPLQGPQPLVVTDMAPDISENYPPPKMHTE